GICTGPAPRTRRSADTPQTNSRDPPSPAPARCGSGGCAASSPHTPSGPWRRVSGWTRRSARPGPSSGWRRTRRRPPSRGWRGTRTSQAWASAVSSFMGGGRGLGQPDRAGLDPVHRIPQTAPGVGVQLMDDLRDLLLDLTDLTAQVGVLLADLAHGHLDLAQPRRNPRPAWSSRPVGLTEPVVEEVPRFTGAAEESATDSPEGDQGAGDCCGAVDPQADRGCVRGMHRLLRCAFRTVPPCGLSSMYNHEYATSLACVAGASPSVTWGTPPRHEEAPGGRGVPPGAFFCTHRYRTRLASRSRSSLRYRMVRTTTAPTPPG